MKGSFLKDVLLKDYSNIYASFLDWFGNPENDRNLFLENIQQMFLKVCLERSLFLIHYT